MSFCRRTLHANNAATRSVVLKFMSERDQFERERDMRKRGSLDMRKRGSLDPRFVVPLLGRLFAGTQEYRYLQESVEAFPAPEAFATLMGECGLKEVTVTPQSFGAAHLYVGRV